jgi:hypothetical protein
MLLEALSLTPAPEQEVLTSIEIEVTPQRFRFWLIPPQRFSFGNEGVELAEMALSTDEERTLLDVAHSMAISNKVWTAASPYSDVVFSPQALNQASMHVRLGFNSGRLWSAWQPLASVPANLWAYCDGLHELATITLHRHAAEFLTTG